MLRYLPSLVLVLSLAVPLTASPDSIRRWVDKDGVVHYSNVEGGSRRAARTKKTKDGGVRVILDGRSSQAKSPPAGRPSFRARETTAYDEILREACERYRIPFAFARAIAAAESNFNPNAVSHAGAMGLMQLMPATAVSMYVDDAFDPRENIHGGVRYLRVLTNLFEGDLVKVTAAYNAGPGAVQRANGIPNIEETQTYVKRVLELYKNYRAQEEST